jgi:hypothetical protein
LLLGRSKRGLAHFKDLVIPRPLLKAGAIVWCDLALGSAEHTGIYVGNDKIIELNGDGYIKLVNLYEFVRSGLSRTGITLYTICDVWGKVLYDPQNANRAINYMEENPNRGYNLFFRNCHQFTAACITGNLNNSCSTFEGVKLHVKSKFNIPFLDDIRVVETF